LEAVALEAKPQTGPGGRKVCEKPAFVIKVGNSLLKCAQLKRGAALRAGDTVALKAAEDFIKLFTNEYTDKMSSAAHASYRIRGNTLCDFPDEADLRKLREYQQNKIAVMSEEIKTNPAQLTWRELAEVILSRILVFNARGSEASDLSVDDYARATNTVDPAVVESLTSVEKQLIQRLKVVNVIGKRNRPVPILLTEDVHGALRLLHDSRAVCGIHPDNKYVFALPGSAKGHLSFHSTLRRVAHNAKLIKPHILTTRLRKHLATMAQVNIFLNM
jgi:hypothetical protein